MDNFGSRVFMADADDKVRELFSLRGLTGVRLSNDGRFIAASYMSDSSPTVSARVKIYDIETHSFFTVKDKVEEIRTVLLERKSASFFEMFSPNYTKNELITTFQAMLELLKLQYITVEQNGMFEDITLTLRDDRNEELGEIDEYN